MKKVVVVGAGGFGREVIEIFKAQNNKEKKYEILGFIDENEDKWEKSLNGYPVLGGTAWLVANKDEVDCVCAIGNPLARERICSKLEEANVNFCNAIHPSVIMSEFTDIGKDVIICAGCILTVNIKISDHVIINLNTTVGHDSTMESYCSIMPNVTISGNNHLHQGVYVGTGATFIHQISIGSWTTIGAGAVVVRDIPESVVALGMPATVIKHKKKEEKP